jgi:hypothetical protein
MAKLKGAQRIVLQAISDLRKDSAGFVTDEQIAQSTRVTLVDVWDSVEILAEQEFVDAVRTQDGFSVAITASGRQALGQFRPFFATPPAGDRPGNSSRSGRSRAEADQISEPRSVELKVNLRAHVVGVAPRASGTGVRFSLAVEAKLVNTGGSPQFIVEAHLRSKTGQHRLGFKKLCDEERPLLAGARRSETLQINDCVNNKYLYNVLRNVCRLNSLFEVVTATGERLAYPAAEVCDEKFLGWPAYVIDEKSLAADQRWFPAAPSVAAASANSPPNSSDVRRGLTPEDIENIRSQAWANVDSFGKSSARCPVDGFPMKITFNPCEYYDADISAYCERHGLVSIEKETDPLRPTFAGKSWTDEQVHALSEEALRRKVVTCLVCGTVVRSKIDGGYVILTCLRCGSHGMTTI